MVAPKCYKLATRMTSSVTTIGHLQEFDPMTDRISTYLERVELFFLANGIAEEKQVPVLLSIVGGKIYSLLSDLLAPDKPSSKTFPQLAGALQKHFEPKPVIIAERFQFHRRNQAANESVAEYEAELRQLATHCAFGNYLGEAIRDRIVCGLRSESIQKHLLAETELTLSKTLEIAKGMEAADRSAQKLKGAEGTSFRVSEVSVGTNSCNRCGSDCHKPKDCCFREAECRNCKKIGHLAKMYRSRGAGTPHTAPDKSASKTSEGKRSFTQPRKNNWISARDSETVETDIFPELSILTVGDHNNKPITVQMELNGQQVLMEVDTGAAVSLMSVTTQKRLFPRAKLMKSTTQLQTYSAEALSVSGTIQVKVRYGSYVGTHTLYVVNGQGPTLLGHEWLMNIRLDWHSLGVATVHSKQPPLTSVLDKYGDVFAKELGWALSRGSRLN